MQSTIPFIHLFKTPYGNYFFDVNTDRVYNTEDHIYDALKKMLDNKEHMIDQDVKEEIEKMKDSGLLKNHRPKIMKHPSSDYMSYHLNNRMESITLQLTQNCNFRCLYCPYGQGNDLNRGHSNRSMSFKTVKESIDFLLQRSSDAERIAVGFYGGEPLLEFDNLKKAVLYAEEVFAGRPLLFNITTNCSLINDEIIDFFNAHHIAILISLDGPKHIHDSKRVFAVNGCGTFDVIMEKLELIKQKYPEYYKNNISFNTVIDPSKEFDCINQMYLSNSLLKDLSAMASLIDDAYSNEKNTYSEAFLAQKGYEDFKTIMCQLGRIQIENISAILKSQVAEGNKLKKTLGQYSVLNQMSHGGPCTIGRKTFIDVEGNIFPCERVSESSKVMHIGHIHTGFDFEKIDRLMNIARLTEDQCKECWAINRCYMCAKFADDGDALCADKKLQNCMDSKMRFEDHLRRYVALKEIKAGGMV